MTGARSLSGGALAHAVVAAGLADPDLLRAWTEEPTRLAAIGIDPAAVDLDSLANFAGLAEKVRQNPCRLYLPLTFRLLGLTGLEIKLFRDYAPESQRRRQLGLNSPMERVDGLANFVERWAMDDDAVGSLIRDVLRHEHALALLSMASPVLVPERRAVRLDGRSVPGHAGRTLVRTLSCDPEQTGAVIRQRVPDLSNIERGRWTFVYHRDTGDRLQVLEVEPGVGHLLLAVDGQASVDDIAIRLFGHRATAGSLLPAFDQLVELGLLGWRADPRGASCG